MPLPSLDGDNRDKKKDEKLSLPDFEMPPIPTEDDFQSLPVEDALYKEDDSKENAEIYEEVEKVKQEKELPKVGDKVDYFGNSVKVLAVDILKNYDEENGYLTQLVEYLINRTY